MRRLLEIVIILVIVAVVVGITYRKDEESPRTIQTPVSSTTPQAPSRPDQQLPLPPASPVETFGLVPLSDKENVPAINKKHTVAVETSQGNFTLEVYPEAAPVAAERFIRLVQAGFYDNIAVSRVVDDFVVQFGINPSMAEWKDRKISDDPTYFQHLPGTIAFAKAGPDTASTQVFINLTENNRLADPSLNFTVFGRITEGMETVGKFKKVGDTAGGLNQERLWNDPASSFPPPSLTAWV